MARVRCRVCANVLLLLILLLQLTLLKTSIAAATLSPSDEVVVLYEECGEAMEVVAALYTPNTRRLPLPCGGDTVLPAALEVEIPPAKKTNSNSNSSQPHAYPSVVVIASCPVIAMVTSILGPNNHLLGGPPSIILPVPTSSSPACTALRQAAGTQALPSSDPTERALHLLLSWMTYHSWKTLTVLYDRSLTPSTFVFFVKGLLDGAARLGARVSFREVPQGASLVRVAGVVSTVVDAWQKNGANHVTAITSEQTLSQLLNVISDFEVEQGERDCDWLVFAPSRSGPHTLPFQYTPTNGHNVFFADTPLHTTLKERSLAAVKVARRTSNTRYYSHQRQRVTIYVRRPEYETLLMPEVTMDRPYPRLVASHRWTPPSHHHSHYTWSHGRVHALPSSRQYLLHGAHLTVATIGGSPFIEPMEEEENSANTTSNFTTHDTDMDESYHHQNHQLPPHVNCTQPRGFSGFLVDLMDVIAKEMDFTFTIYEVCDKAYGSEVDGRWTGVMGEVVEGRAHLGLANLGANYGRSHAVAFPRISTSYGGGGIILRRPESSAKDRLTVYMLPFSYGVWVFLLASMPVAAFAMHLATSPRHALHRRLIRVFSFMGGMGDNGGDSGDGGSGSGAVDGKGVANMTLKSKSLLSSPLSPMGWLMPHQSAASCGALHGQINPLPPPPPPPVPPSSPSPSPPPPSSPSCCLLSRRRAVPTTQIKVFITSAGKAATTRLWTMADSWPTLNEKEKCGEARGEEEEAWAREGVYERGAAGEEDDEDKDEPQSFLDGLWFAFTVLMQQGQEVVPGSGVARAVFGLVWVSAVILYAAYTSNLVSHFTVTRFSLPINNLDELVASDYKFGTRTGSVYIDNMKVSDSGGYQSAYRKLHSFGTNVLMPTYEDAIERTLQGSYAFIGDYVVLDYYQRKDCNLVLLKQRMFPTMISIALPHGSPLLPAFNHYLSLMSESGIMEKLRQKWWSAQPCPSAATRTAYHSIEMKEVFSALVVMGAGLATALLICCLECLRPPLLT